IGGTGHQLMVATEAPEWVITRARFTIKFHSGPEGGSGKSLTLTVTMPHGCNLKDMTQHERLIGEKYLRRWGILTDTADLGDVVEQDRCGSAAAGDGNPRREGAGGNTEAGGI